MEGRVKHNKLCEEKTNAKAINNPASSKTGLTQSGFHRGDASWTKKNTVQSNLEPVRINNEQSRLHHRTDGRRMFNFCAYQISSEGNERQSLPHFRNGGEDAIMR